MALSSTALLGVASGAVSLVAALVKEMPELIEVIENAIDKAKSGTVVTAEDVATQIKAVDALNAQIQTDAAAVIAGSAA